MQAHSFTTANTNTFTHTYAHILTHTHTYTHARVLTYINTHKHIHTRTSSHQHLHTLPHRHSQSHSRIHVHMHTHIHSHTYAHTLSHTHPHTHNHTYIVTRSITLTRAHIGLEIGGFVSPNANHFWGNGESLWPTVLPYFLCLCESLLTDAWQITFSNEFAKRSFFFILTPFLEKFYVHEAKLRINCELLRINLKSDLPFLARTKKMANHFLFLKFSSTRVHAYTHTHFITHI